MRSPGILAALACSACNLIFPVGEATPDAAEAPDAPRDGGPACTSVIDEDFDASNEPPCGIHEEVGMGVSRNNGHLEIKPDGSMAPPGACQTSPIDLFSAGIHVIAAPLAFGMFAELALLGEDQRRIAMVVIPELDKTELHFQVDGVDVGAVAYSFQDHVFWRLRVVEGRVISEVSADGASYHPLVPGDTRAPAKAQVIIGAGILPGRTVTAPALTVLDDLAGCP